MNLRVYVVRVCGQPLACVLGEVFSAPGTVEATASYSPPNCGETLSKFCSFARIFISRHVLVSARSSFFFVFASCSLYHLLACVWIRSDVERMPKVKQSGFASLKRRCVHALNHFVIIRWIVLVNVRHFENVQYSALQQAIVSTLFGV